MTDDRFNLIVALYVLSNNYHSGQWSRGYRLLSRIITRYKPVNLPSTEDELYAEEWLDTCDLYTELKNKYKDIL